MNKFRKILDVSMLILTVVTIGMFVGFAFVNCLYAFIIPGITGAIVVAYLAAVMAKSMKNKNTRKLNATI